MYRRPLVVLTFAASLAFAQPPAEEPQGLKVEPPPSGDYTVTPGTKIPLSLINSISTKSSMEGDVVYLKTAFPVKAGGRIVIPVGSYVQGTVTQVKRPGRVKGRGELYIRFDSLTFGNGVTRDFRSRMGGVDAQASGELDRAEGKVKSEGNKSGDARTVGEAAGAGASIGGIVGSVAGHAGKGVGIGAAAGAASGLIGVLASRGPDAILASGTIVEMVLDRPLYFTESEVNFTPGPEDTAMPKSALPKEQANQSGGILLPRRKN